MLFSYAYLVKRCISFDVSKAARRFKSAAGLTSMVQAPWTPQETIQALEAFRGTHLSAFVHLSVFLGLRKGEAFALKWSDVDFERKMLVISKGRSPRRNLGSDLSIRTIESEGPTKSGKDRHYPIPDLLLNSLLEEKERQGSLAEDLGERWLGTGHVVCSPLGGPAPISRTDKDFKAILREHNLRVIRLHDQRHTASVLSLIGGSRLEATSQSIGHSSTDFTKRTYAQHVPGFAIEFTDGISKVLANSSGGTHD
jgi:integrase